MARLSPAIQRLVSRPESDRRLGPFRLVEQLGHGGFAPVWLAREVYGSTDLRTAAVKLFALEPGVRRQIVEEARSLCRIEHPNVVRFYALPIDEDLGVMGLAMEHVAGESLAGRPLSLAEALAAGIAVASALAAVHRAGLVHRDVKPANVVEAGGTYKLIDFGIAAASAAEAAPELAAVSPVATPDGATEPLGPLMGTVGYVDPVCLATGAPATAASDLYALGAMLHQVLGGELPAGAPLCSIAPGTPPALGRLVDALVAPDRRERPPSAEWVAVRLEQIREEIAGARRPLPPESVGPFRGLGRFEEQDRDVYFGRRAEVAAVVETLRSRSLIALVGPSGSGKSSLARAGVLPALAGGAMGGRPAAWDTAIAEPEDDPRAAVAAALSPFVPEAAELAPEAVLRALAARSEAAQRGLVLLVDQLEALATVAPGASRAWTAALIAQAGEQLIPGVRVVVTARRDLLDPLLALPDLGRSLGRGMVLVEPIARAVWGTILDQALSAYDYRFEDEALRAELLAELEGTGDAMPLVQFALTRLWRARDVERRILPRAGLRAIGGLAGALERHADATLAELAIEHEDAEAAMRSVLLSLTTPRGTRAIRGVEELVDAAGPAGREVLAALDTARLVTPAGAGVTLAHEALITQWGRLRGWVAEVREDRVLAEELERDAARWRADPEAVPFWQKRHLSFGEELARRRSVPISAAAGSFLRASRRAERRARLLLAGSAAVALLSIAAAGGAYVLSARAGERAAQASLAKEQEARRLEEEIRRIAEQRTREVERKQAEIDALMLRLSAEEDRERRRDLEAQIRRTVASTRPGPAVPTAAPAPTPLPTTLPPEDWK
jgi:hypothetical protein